MSRYLVAALAVLATSFAFAEETSTEIPLKGIWAYAMPGTRNVLDIEPPPIDPAWTESERLERTHTAQIKRVLARIEPKTAGKGFAVEGTGRKALLRAYETLVQKAKRKSSLRPGEITVVFYGLAMGFYLEIDKVTFQDGEAVIYYHLIPHETLDLTMRFALIPLGVLADGDKIKVTMAETKRPEDARLGYMSEADKKRTISGPFSFSVNYDHHQRRALQLGKEASHDQADP